MKKFLITEEDKRHILSLYNLVEDFKSQKKKFIDQGYDEVIVDKYLNDFREIKDKKFKELEKADLEGLSVEKGLGRYDIDRYKTFKEVELVVDYMSGLRNFGSANFQDIKVDGKPIFEDEEIEIYYAPNKQSCVEYKGNKPYSWCIARADASNMFLRYRTGSNRPSFYFVKRKKATIDEFNYWNNSGEQFVGTFNDKWHFFVIQVLKNGGYIVTSSMNDGDVEMTWEEILKLAPELKGKKDYFQSKPLSDEEFKKYEKYKKGLSNEEFYKLPYVEKEHYIDTYVSESYLLTDKQFSYLSDDLKNKYINLGVDLSDNQILMIKDNQKLLKRYIEVFNETFKTKFIDLPYISNFSKIKLQLLNDENERLIEEVKLNSINSNLHNLVISLEKFPEYYFDIWVTPQVYDILNGIKDIKHNYDLSLVKTSNFTSETMKNNPRLLKYLFFINLAKTSNTNDFNNEFNDFLNHYGINYEKFKKSFNEDELEFYNDIISLKK